MRREAIEQLGTAIAELPEDFRQVVYLRYHDGLSYEEIAARIGKTEEATRKFWSRALVTLSERMKGVQD